MQQVHLAVLSNTGEGHAGHGKPCLPEGNVESLPIKRHNNLRFLEFFIEAVQEGQFFVVVPHEKLLDHKAATDKAPCSYQERVGTRSPCKARGFCIQEQSAGKIYLRQIPLRDARQSRGGRRGQRFPDLALAPHLVQGESLFRNMAGPPRCLPDFSP